MPMHSNRGYRQDDSERIDVETAMPQEQTDHPHDVSTESTSWIGRTYTGIRRYFGTHSFGFFAGSCCCVLCAVILVLPSAYVIEAPGPTQNVLGSRDGTAVISISGGRTAVYTDTGKLLLLTVNASGTPEYPVTNAEALIAWMNPRRTVTPSEVVFPIGQSSTQYVKEQRKEMSGSQQSSAKAALAYARSMGIDTRGIKISMHVDDIGGPSAGMMYALGVLDKLTARSETGGKTIAGTGTIDAQGRVGKIGGIRLKMLGARRDGATWFLAPQSNCSEVVGHVPQGLRDVRVTTLADAYSALLAIGQGKGSSLPHCTASVK